MGWPRRKFPVRSKLGLTHGGGVPFRRQLVLQKGGLLGPRTNQSLAAPLGGEHLRGVSRACWLPKAKGRSPEKVMGARCGPSLSAAAGWVHPVREGTWAASQAPPKEGERNTRHSCQSQPGCLTPGPVLSSLGMEIRPTWHRGSPDTAEILSGFINCQSLSPSLPRLPGDCRRELRGREAAPKQVGVALGGGTALTPILQTWKWTHREVQSLARVPTARMWRRQDLNSGH